VAKTRVATSADVARRAGVSRAAVSGVLNGAMSTMRVSEGTRLRVLAAALELDYSPNPIARALRRQRSNVIGFVPRSSRRTPYEHPVPFLLGACVAAACMKRDYHVVEASAESIRSRESDELVRFLLDRHVDGVVLDSPETSAEVRRFVDRGLPVLQLIRPRPEVTTPSIIVDAKPGTVEALEHIIEHRHRRIAFIGHGGPHPADRSRLDCFAETLIRDDVPVRDGWVRLVDDYGIDQGREAGHALLSLSERPTAVFVAGDNLALGVLQAFYQANVRVPDDMSLVSYDDIFAAHLAPPLTSVAQPLEAVADRAIALIVDSLDGVESIEDPTVDVILPTNLIVRGSVRPPRLGKEDNAA
jgi:LacI family transcriptional regulator